MERTTYYILVTWTANITKRRPIRSSVNYELIEVDYILILFCICSVDNYMLDMHPFQFEVFGR